MKLWFFELEIEHMKILFGLAILAGVLSAQGDMRVYPAALIAGEQVRGKLVLMGNSMAFVDDQRPESSFEVTKSNIRDLSSEGDTVTVQLRNAVRDRAGSATRLIVRLESAPDASGVQRWFGAATGAAVRPASGAASAADAGAETMTFSAQRKKRLRSNTDGKLIIDSERVIFESADNADESRRWELSEIKEIKLKNPYDFEVRTFRGEKYNLALSGLGMDNSQYREIVDRVTKARTAR
ncbi:MAG: hypothetical protein HS123_06945 [Solibacteraceae bacterium]|nr:hypothetical protein [Solibacteraceae bacterium]